MSLNYNILETFKLLLNAFKYDIFIAIIIGMTILVLLLILNKNNKKINYLVYSINLILIIIISIYYIKDIISFKFSNPINNIYFYFFNSIIYLIVTSIILNNKYKKLNYIIYGLSLINLLFALFMTHYLSNQTLIVIGNIFPMIKFGNIIYILYYIFLIVIYIKRVFLTNRL
jgi:hypothetical protein